MLLVLILPQLLFQLLFQFLLQFLLQFLFLLHLLQLHLLQLLRDMNSQMANRVLLLPANRALLQPLQPLQQLQHTDSSWALLLRLLLHFRLLLLLHVDRQAASRVPLLQQLEASQVPSLLLELLQLLEVRQCHTDGRGLVLRSQLLVPGP